MMRDYDKNSFIHQRQDCEFQGFRYEFPGQLIWVLKMKKLKLYLETSVFGFYFDSSAPNKQKRIAVRKLLQQIKNGIFEGYISGLVRTALEKAPQPYRDRLLRLIDRYSLKAVEYDEEAVGELHENYLWARVAPGGSR